MSKSLETQSFNIDKIFCNLPGNIYFYFTCTILVTFKHQSMLFLGKQKLTILYFIKVILICQKKLSSKNSTVSENIRFLFD